MKKKLIYKKCKKHEFRVLKEFHVKGQRFLHFYCTRCLMEDIKICDWSTKDIKKMLKGGKNGKSNR